MSRATSKALLVTFLVALISLGAMEIYRENALRGDIANHVLSAKSFGIADSLAQHGIKPFLTGDAESGWDGQFYYAISNDLLARTDVPKHIDAPAYRYQRIGLPLVAWVVSRLTLQDWVSPLTYFLTNLGIVLFATFVASRHFARSGVSAWWAWVWATTVGVQITLLNGLPDASADAFLIASFVYLAQGRRMAYLVCATLAALTRESYVLMPVVVGIVGLWDLRGAESWRERAIHARAWIRRSGWPVLVPVVVFVAWQAYVRWAFGRSPASYTGTIVGLPMHAWFRFVSASLAGHHPAAPAGWPSLREAVGLIFFALLLGSVAWIAVVALRRSTRDDVATRSIATFFIALVALYACFGETVILNYTGYMKSASLLFVAVPFLSKALSSRARTGLAIVLALANLFFASYLWRDRIAQPAYDVGHYVRRGEVTNDKPIACLAARKVGVKLVGIEPLRPDTIAGTALNRDVSAFDVAFTNLSNQRYDATLAAGSVTFGSVWLRADDDEPERYGERSYLPEGLAPGETRIVPILVRRPSQPGRYVLRLTAVQEGCGWFYDTDPGSKLDIDYTIR